jgi:hypothetical protein
MLKDEVFKNTMNILKAYADKTHKPGFKEVENIYYILKENGAIWADLSAAKSSHDSSLLALQWLGGNDETRTPQIILQ